ncbi:hypothetical protein C2E23DRAFT_111845 [Lenzites betulinus]|nr:hypothetical protein C2E23DRAFT_111845 [Lenzites betulinus]
MKTWESNEDAVESKGVPGMVGSTWSAAATEWLEGKEWTAYQLPVRIIGRLGNHVRGEEGDDLVGREAGVAETLEDLRHRVERLRDEQVRGRCDRAGAPEEVLEAGCARAVREPDRAGELDATDNATCQNPTLRQMMRAENSQVASGHVVLRGERLLGVHDLINTVVRVERGLDGVEGHDRAVCTAATKDVLPRERRREADGVVEREPERLVRLLAALAPVEEVLLEVVDDGEERAAHGVAGRVHAIGAGNSAGNGR